jgi:hypothetical protein
MPDDIEPPEGTAQAQVDDLYRCVERLRVVIWFEVRRDLVRCRRFARRWLCAFRPEQGER